MKHLDVLVDVVFAVLLWIVALSFWNLDDNLAYWLGRFAADVVTGFNS